MGPKQETKKPAAAPAKEAAKPAAKAAAKSAAKPAKPASEKKAAPTHSFQLAVGLKKGRAIQKRTARVRPSARKGVRIYLVFIQRIETITKTITN